MTFAKPILIPALLLFVSGVYADEVLLTSDEIVSYLNGSEVVGNQKGTAWRQTFSADGGTYYEEANGFRPASGRWKAQNDKYCSQWPPSDIWSCYKMTATDHQLTFIPPKGDPWPAVRLEKK